MSTDWRERQLAHNCKPHVILYARFLKASLYTPILSQDKPDEKTKKPLLDHMAHLHSINRIDLENYKILKHTPKHQRTRFHSIIHPHPQLLHFTQLLAFSFLSLSFPFHFLISLPSLSWLCLLQISHILHLFFCSLKKPSMAKTVLLIALCLLLALAVESRPMKNPFVVEGKVYCDTCRAGFETSATTYIPGKSLTFVFTVLV